MHCDAVKKFFFCHLQGALVPIKKNVKSLNVENMYLLIFTEALNVLMWGFFYVGSGSS